VKVFTKLKLNLEAMLHAAANPIKDGRHNPYQIFISWNANLRVDNLYGYCGSLTLDKLIQTTKNPAPPGYGRHIWAWAEHG